MSFVGGFIRTSTKCFPFSAWRSGFVSKMLIAPAVERNKQAILDVLKEYYKPNFNGRVLEIASGTGGHIIHFAREFPSAVFQPSEINPRCLHSIVAHIDHFRPANIRVPLFIDVSLEPDRWALPADYGPGTVDVVLCLNTIHISSNAAVSGLFHSSQGLLKQGGRLIVYGAFGFDGKITPESNVHFDQDLRSENPEWGLRFVEDLRTEADRCSLKLTNIHAMPANNHVLVFVRD